MFLAYLRHPYLYGLVAAVKYFHRILVDNSCLQPHRTPCVDIYGRQLHFLCPEIVSYDGRCVGAQRIIALKTARAVECAPSRPSGLPGRTRKTLTDTLEVGNLVVELVERQTPLGSPCGLVGYLVAELHTIYGSAAVPSVCGIVGELTGQEIERRYLVEGRTVSGYETLVVGPGSAEMQY